MKIKILTVLLLWGSLVVAVPKAQTSELRSSIPGESSKNTFVAFGGGLAFLSGNTGWALNTGVLTEVKRRTNLFVGADLGLNFWSLTPMSTVSGSYSTGNTAIQLLPTAVYRFELGNESVYPYVGLSMGPNIFINRLERVAGNSTTKDSSTDVYFELLFRPGVFTHLSGTIALNLEAKLGLLRSDFIFLPSANLVFAM